MNSIVLHILMSTHLYGMLSDMILHRSLSVTTSRGHSTGTRFSALAKMFLTSRVAKMFPQQLVRQLDSQGGDITGEEVSATPRKIFQILNQVL